MGDWADEHDQWEDDDYPGCEGEDTRSCPTCKKCGKIGLTWYETADGWRLFENKGLRLVPHVCKEQDHSNAFEDES